MPKFQNVRRASVSFLWVSGAFLVYSICIAPFIESSYNANDEVEAATYEASEERSSDRYVRELASLFPKGSWELDRPKVLRSQQATILLNEFEQQEDSLRIKKCSLVFYGSDRGRADPNSRGPIILQAPEGAILDFDKPIDLSRGVIGRPVGGKLVGKIRIFSAGGVNSEDLEMTTSNVVITDQRIWTPEQVSFRLGNNFGVGRYLIIERAAGTSADEPSREDGDWLAGLGRVELQHLERFTVEMAGEDMFSSLGNRAAPGPVPTTAPPSSTIELRCDGPLHFDLHEMVATVDRNVRITRTQVGTSTDTVKASKLSMRLARVAPIEGAESDKAELAVTRIVAVGQPLVIDARSKNTYVESRRLEYDFHTKRVKLRGFQPRAGEPAGGPPDEAVRIQNPTHSITAREIEFAGNSDRNSWRMSALGPGQYMGAPNPEATQQVAASWTNLLSLTPAGDQHVLRIDGKASVRAPGAGSIHAERIELWIRHEQEVVAQRIDGTPVYETTSKPTKLVTAAQQGGRTIIEAPRISGTLTNLTVVFLGDEYARPVAAPEKATPHALAGQLGTASSAEQPLTPGEASPARYRIDGGELTAWVTLNPQQLHRMAIRGQTQLIEEPRPGIEPFELAGQNIDFQIARDGKPTAQLQGSPAVLSSPKLRLSGQTVHLKGDQNRVEIPGPGSMRLRLPGNLVSSEASPPAAAPEAAVREEIDVDLHWRSGLEFDGQIANLRGDVVVSSKDLNVRTKHLQVGLVHAMDLANLGTDDVQPELRDLTARGGIEVANRSRDEVGQMTGLQQIVAQDFHLDYASGDAKAQGPGWLSTTTQGQPSTGGIAGTPPPANADQSAQRMHLSVAFSRQLEGNIHRRSCQLTDDIRAWYGPVNNWEDRVDPVQVERLEGKQLRLTCRELLLMESPSALANTARKPIELFARGETYVESERYAAKGHQIKFAEEKGMLTLEGDAQRPAELWQRNLVSGQSSHSGRARTIRYWPKTGQLEVKFLGIDLSQTPQILK